MTLIRASVLQPGEAQGPVQVLDAPLSFWGGFDPTTGAIVDRHHPQCGATLTGAVVVLPASRGSGTTPGAIAEAVRLGTAPAGIVLGDADVNLAIGCFIAAELYGRACPVVVLAGDDYRRIAAWPAAAISAGGLITRPSS